MTPNALKRISGKNSSIDGPWNSPSVASRGIRVAARLNSAGSSFGAPVRTGATMVGVLQAQALAGERRAHLNTIRI
jgi:hypothetical protein